MTAARYADGTPKLAPTLCLGCGWLLNASASADLRRKRVPLPRPGNVSLCLNCGHLALFADDLTLREPTAAENAEPEIIELRRQAKAAAAALYDGRTGGGQPGVTEGRA